MAVRYGGYHAHESRREVVHASDDGLVVLLGGLSLNPGTEASYRLEYPAVAEPEPEIEIRFVPVEDLAGWIAACDDGEKPYPDDLSTWDVVDTVWEGEEADAPLDETRPGRFRASWARIPAFDGTADTVGIRCRKLTFRVASEEGAYLFRIRYGSPVPDGPGETSVVIYNKARTFFPRDHDDDLADLLYRTVNLSRKNGVLWFVHPIYFVEQHLNVVLDDAVIEEMVNCEGLPADLPAADPVLVPLQWGWGHQGLKKIRLDVDPQDDEPCYDVGRVRIQDKEFEFEDFIRKVPV